MFIFISGGCWNVLSGKCPHQVRMIFTLLIGRRKEFVGKLVIKIGNLLKYVCP